MLCRRYKLFMEAREAEEGEIQEEMDEVEAEIAKKAR
jgi:hypothetical protein